MSGIDELARPLKPGIDPLSFFTSSSQDFQDFFISISEACIPVGSVTMRQHGFADVSQWGLSDASNRPPVVE